VGLIKLGRVIKSYIAKVSGSGALAQWLAVEEFAGDERKAQVFGPSNEDFAPPNDMSTIDVPLGRDRGFLTSVAYRNKKISPVAVAGESRKYSTNEAGDVVMAEVFLKQDGTILVKNANGSMELEPDGKIGLYRGSTFIRIGSAGNVTIEAPIITLNAGVVNINGVDVNFGSVTVKHGGVNIGKTHVHSANNVDQPLTGLPQ
jgi:hypothetical protein